MKQVLIRRGQAVVETVPAPLVEPGHLLVEVAYSLISTGTELSGVQQSGKPLLRRALEQPDKLLLVVNHLRERGIQKTIARVRGQLESGSPTGYSCSGVVLQVGAGVTDLHVGDRVACAGAGIANHAELVLAPRNLVTLVPEACPLKDAASVTLGAIAMQGVRRADPRLGEFVAVIGLGLLGQLTVQMLKAAGCRVIGFDVDARRTALAGKLGADHVFVVTAVDAIHEVRQLTGGHGVDAVIVTAASHSDEIVQQAMEIARKKGRVVVVGAVGLGLKRSPFYEKELDLLISSSYGPGRYDHHYEQGGVDYPYAYVRWTENRNMAEYLRLVGEGKIRLESILEQEYALAEATQAYQRLQTAEVKPLAVVLRYPQDGDTPHTEKLATRVTLSQRPVAGRIRIALVGAGGFARGVHLPNLQKLSGLYHLRAVVSATGSNAKAAATQFGADYATSNYEDVLHDPDVDAVLIATRHDLHAAQATAAANAGKAVFLEKPLALNQSELDAVSAAFTATQTPLMVGFNRRFSPAARRLHAALAGRQSPLMMLYRVNAGYLPPDHWTQGAEGGGRIIGEACHMLDLFQFLVDGAAPVDLTATAIESHLEQSSGGDNTSITVRYADGSVGTLLYTALGPSGLAKEYVEVFTDNKGFVIDDYKALRAYGATGVEWSAPLADKGHLAELEEFARYVRGEIAAPIPLREAVATTWLTFAATGQAQTTEYGVDQV
jgi:predicted dehydrogenase/threonine dehydrogenase-like Zn-dependent dehydrogenase